MDTDSLTTLLDHDSFTNGTAGRAPRKRHNSWSAPSMYTRHRSRNLSGRRSRNPSDKTIQENPVSGSQITLNIALPTCSQFIWFLLCTFLLAGLVMVFIGCVYIELGKMESIYQGGLFKPKATLVQYQHIARFPPEVSWFSDITPEENLPFKYIEHEQEIKSHAALDAKAMQRARKKLEVKESLKQEAYAAYKAALENIRTHHTEKAQKLLKHALSLDPVNADILNAYGEVVESSNLVLADHMFNQAISIAPTHTKAIINIRRTAPLVLERDSTLYNRIDAKRDLIYQVPESNPGLRRLKKELYYKHIYNTVAIEGSTLNLYQTRSIVETRVAIGGKSIAEHNEVLGMDAALSYINMTLLNRIGQITLNDILEIHKRVMGYVDPIAAGQLRNNQVFVGNFIPPRPGEVQNLMEEFINWLNGEESDDLHPIRLAAISHYKLVTIHPFFDGNGRTSRLLMNLVLMHAGYPPVMVRVEQKHEYYKHLETANQGDMRPFVRFIAKCTEQTIDEYLVALSDRPDLHHDLAMYEYEDDGRTIIIDELHEKEDNSESETIP